MRELTRFFQTRPRLISFFVLLGLFTLPVVVWLDLRSVSDQNLNRQANALTRVITGMRGYYAENVAARIDSNTRNPVSLSHTYQSVDGAVPLPATMSIELEELIGDLDRNLTYRFVSDHPFRNRDDRELSAFENRALLSFRQDGAKTSFTSVDGGVLDRRIFLATPVKMESACVACHNSHDDSTKRDWKIGDVRGVQVLEMRQPILFNIWSFKWLLTYLSCAGGFGILFMFTQQRLAREFGKLSKYLPPQVYSSIFSGTTDASISTERKKLTVFFSDIKDFTATTESLQPEELTQLLNEYFTEMSAVAEKHGATIDKFIGDAMVAFFGDPDTKGSAEDARACVRMAIEMQHRLEELADSWRLRGIEHAFLTRMGINTGYCNVGNFGSEDRIDYTIIGAEANLAARLEGIAEPGGIVVSYETYALVRNIVEGRALEPVRMKGLARDVVPYEILVPDPKMQERSAVTDLQTKGLSIRLDPSQMDGSSKEAAREALRKAMLDLEAAGLRKN